MGSFGPKPLVHSVGVPFSSNGRKASDESSKIAFNEHTLLKAPRLRRNSASSPSNFYHTLVVEMTRTSLPPASIWSVKRKPRRTRQSQRIHIATQHCLRSCVGDGLDASFQACCSTALLHLFAAILISMRPQEQTHHTAITCWVAAIAWEAAAASGLPAPRG